MSLPTAPLGKDGPIVSRMGLGLMGLSIGYGPAKPDEERLAFLDAAYALGQRNWDSANVYSDNEDLIGKWFKLNPDKRNDIFLATKFSILDGTFTVDTSPENVKASISKSLERLGLPYVDLFYAHRLDMKTPIEKTVKAMAELKEEGKIKYLGLSECSAESLRRAHKVHPISAVQVEYSPFALEIESAQINLLNTARELGVAIVAYSPLGRGLLTGALRSPDDFADDDFRRSLPRFSKENFPKSLVLVDQLNEMAKNKGATTSQLVLAWLMEQGLDIFPIPGTTKIERLKENTGAFDVKLSKEENQKIREICEAAEVFDRYPESLAAALFADTPAL